MVPQPRHPKPQKPKTQQGKRGRFGNIDTFLGIQPDVRISTSMTNLGR